MLAALPFRRIIAVDFEFEFGGHDTLEAAGHSGERPRPVCMVAKDLRSGQVWRLWRDQFGSQPPFPIDADTLLVAYYASAELGCFGIASCQLETVGNWSLAAWELRCQRGLR